MPSEPVDGPEFEVWNHLDQAIHNVYNEMEERLEQGDIALWEAVANHLLSLRLGVVVNPADVETPPFLKSLAPTAPDAIWKKIVLSLGANPVSWHPWLRQAVEVQIAQRGICRSEEALDRYAKLQAKSIGRQLPDKALPYVNQVVDCYLFGFDVACIALACACFEQLAKFALIAVGELTEARIRKDRPEASRLLELLTRRDLLGKASRGKVSVLIENRNTLLHQGIFDERVLPTLSLDAVGALVEICVDLSPSWKEANVDHE